MAGERMAGLLGSRNENNQRKGEETWNSASCSRHTRIPRKSPTRIAPCTRRARFTVAFSAKESLYKCLAPTVGAFFGFEDARVLEASAERVRLRLERTLHPALPAGALFDVRWALEDARVRSALEW